jgi:hypothetical protein
VDVTDDVVVLASCTSSAKVWEIVMERMRAGGRRKSRMIGVGNLLECELEREVSEGRERTT